MHRLYRLLFSFALLLVSASAFADLGGFYYEKVKYEAFVHKNNEWDVKETFVINFLEPRHGFYRFVPIKFSLWHDVTKDSGEKDRVEFPYIVDIDDVEVTGGPIHEETEEMDNYIIQIGDEDRTVEGLQTYVISYKFKYPDDRVQTKDLLFHTILGADFKEDIRHFDFKIEFEKPLPQKAVDNLKWYSGRYGDQSNIIPILYEATPTYIAGTCDSIRPNHALTASMELPEGYYEGVDKVQYFWHYLWLALTVVCMSIIIFRALTIDRGRSVVKTIEFYPPEGISSAEVGVIIDNSVDEGDISSLIPWFAEKGYLKIEETKYKKIVLTKLKSLPENAPKYQKKLMDLFFPKGTTTVRLSQLGDKSAQMNEVKSALKKVFSEDGKRGLVKLDSWVFMYIPLLLFGTLTIATNIVHHFRMDELYIAGFIWLLPTVLGLSLRLSGSDSDLYSSTFKRVIYFLVKFTIMATVALIYSEIPDYGSPMVDWEILLFFLANFITIELCGRFNLNTDYRIDMMGRLLGFKEFIETAEKENLERLQMEDATYFYRVLPYAMVFGLANTWARKFKTITVEKPDWYSTAGIYSGPNFTNHLVSSVNDTVRSHVSSCSHSSSHGGGHSGGGFSGGGGGGGGGGSW